MVSPTFQSDLIAMVTLDWPQIDLLAVVPYVLPLIFLATALLLYQRHMPQNEPMRNLVVLIIIGCYFSAFLLVLYSGYGAEWWGDGDWTMGSWLPFMGAIDWLTNTVFGSIYIGTIYIIAIS